MRIVDRPSPNHDERPAGLLHLEGLREVCRALPGRETARERAEAPSGGAKNP